MKKNMGSMDITIRIIIAVIIALLYFMDKISGTTATVLLIIAGIFILTSIIGFCPLYRIIGINTCKMKK